MTRTIWTFAAVVAMLLPGLPARAASSLPVPMAYQNVGEILFSTGTETFYVTQGGKGKSWPRLSPDKTEIAYVDHGNIWIAYVGSGKEYISLRQITTSGDAGGPSWSPHGDYLAYRTGSVYTGTLYQVRVSANPHPEVLRTWRHTPKSGASLREANTVAWSPDGRYIAFPGGECWAIYDDCLSILDLRTNSERTVAAFAGGGAEQSGFATVPSWGRGSDKLFWTQRIENGPLRSYGYHLVQRNRWQIGKDGDAIPVPIGHGRFLVTSRIEGQEWITHLESGGSRVGVAVGTQHDWRPSL